MQISSLPPPQLKIVNQDSFHFKDPPVFCSSTTISPEVVPFTTKSTSTATFSLRISVFELPQLAFHRLSALSSNGRPAETILLSYLRCTATRSTLCGCGSGAPITGAKHVIVEPSVTAAALAHVATFDGLWVLGPQPP